MVGTGDSEVGAIELTVGYKQSESKLTIIVHRCRFVTVIILLLNFLA